MRIQQQQRGFNNNDTDSTTTMRIQQPRREFDNNRDLMTMTRIEGCTHEERGEVPR
jgi:hypothetical protein